MQDAKNRHFGTMAQLCRTVSSQLRRILTTGKNLLNNSISSWCPHSMVNFGPLTAEISLPVWGTPGNFNFGSVTARHSSSGRQPNFVALNRGRHLCSAGWPSRLALGHILVCLLATLQKNFWTDLHEIFREGWQSANEQMITFQWQSVSQSGYRVDFLDSSLLWDTESD